MRWVRFVAASLVVVGCSSSTPATTPTSVPTTSTTTLATTTTVDRITEIEAIYQDLEERRLDALYRGDEEAYRALFANDAYLEASMGAFDVIEFAGPPGDVQLHVEDVLWDSGACIAATVNSSPVSGIVGSTQHSRVIVIEVANGSWGLSFVGKGWACEGPHPFS